MTECNITDPAVLTVSGVVMDLESHTVKRGRKTIRLNRKEFSLLAYLMRNAGVTLTRDMILEHVWDMNADPFTNTVDVHIRQLRHKLGAGAMRLVQTVHGYGYKFAAR